MRVPQTYVQHTKAGLHFAQAFCVFITGCLALAVLTKDGGTGGATGYMFGLCFLTIPALIYQVMVPMWTRAWRFANVYAYAALDLSFALLWFASFIAVAVWNSAGVRNGNKNEDEAAGDGSCSHFTYGSAQKCEVSKASSGMGAVVWLLFAVTSAMSIHGVIQYRRTGIMPNGNSQIHGQVEQLVTEDASKDPWNASTDELEPGRDSHDEDERLTYGQVNRPEDSEQGVGLLGGGVAASHVSPDELSRPHPGRELSYGSKSELSITAPAYDEHLAFSALSPSGYQQSPDGGLSFPNGNYGEAFR